MRCRVLLLRRNGRRLPWRQVDNGPSFEGALSTYYLTLANGPLLHRPAIGPGDAFRKPVLPSPYEPVLTRIGNGVLILLGFEREGEAATVQEWRCKIQDIPGSMSRVASAQ